MAFFKVNHVYDLRSKFWMCLDFITYIRKDFGNHIGSDKATSKLSVSCRLSPLKNPVTFMELVFLEMDVESTGFPDSGLPQHRTGSLESSYHELTFVFHIVIIITGQKLFSTKYPVVRSDSSGYL